MATTVTEERSSADGTLVETPAVGVRIRALREAMDLSLRDLAQRSGVSAPMLSQVERGETSPALAVASRIAAGLELTLSQLLRLDESEGLTVVRAPERLGVARGGHPYEVATPALPGQRGALTIHTLAPGGPTGGSSAADQVKNKTPRDEVEPLVRNPAQLGVPIYSIGSAHRELVHVIGRELGVTQTGKTLDCGDSHTSGRGAFGAGTFGNGP